MREGFVSCSAQGFSVGAERVGFRVRSEVRQQPPVGTGPGLRLRRDITADLGAVPTGVIQIQGSEFGTGVSGFRDSVQDVGGLGLDLGLGLVMRTGCQRA